ncbi:hypothetical protein B0H34DRAFT_190820 [Crassisporium funariophilum]|nr:hypothetical protein B0H34DRAFT_190820 [Crassisporium funariophilum]
MDAFNIACPCPSPDNCLCPNSPWFYNPDNNPLPPPTLPPNHQLSQALAPGLGPPQHYGYTYTSTSYPRHPYSHQIPYHLQPSQPHPIPNSIAFPIPLGNTTTAIVNTPTAPLPPRKSRKQANSLGGPAKKKARVSYHGAVATPTLPITTASVVGVGPITPLSSTLDIPVNPTYEAIQKSVGVIGSGAERKDRALDVWSFVVGVEKIDVDTELIVKAMDLNVSIPITTTKPSSPFLECRLCMKSGHWYPPWANGKSVTSTIRRHLQSKHEDYPNLLSGMHLISKDMVADANLDNDVNFELAKWHDTLVDWIVVDDQAVNVVECPEFRRFALFGRKGLTQKDLPHRTTITNMIYRQYLKDHDALKKILGSSCMT